MVSSSGATELVGRRATVEVPATIANLGAGYDCLGLAVDLRLRASVEVIEAGGELTVDGEGSGELVADRSNRLIEALELGLAELRVDDLGSIGWRLELSNPIPLARGLGSSAAATVAGLVLAGALAGRELGTEAALGLATRIEGHPDNVAPALLGGLVASIAVGSRVEAVRLEPPAGLLVVAWVPERRLSTADMRRVLPSTVPHDDAVANLARVAVGVAGLASGRADVLRLLTEDRLHEPYRAAAYPELPELVAAARAAGALGACLAGAGSTIAAFIDADTAGAADSVAEALRSTATRLGQPGRIMTLAPAPTGARIT
ncbi:MAG: homoserine kinase [Chloroflexi bacterium]|nr:homoserine kinase [Chloroflexota bacterium]